MNRTEQALEHTERAFSGPQVLRGRPPATQTGRPRRAAASAPALERALARWATQQAGLVREATAQLAAQPGVLTDQDITTRVHRGLWIAWARYLAAPDPKSAFQAATAFGIFFDKWRLSQGLPTAITEERRHERLELLAKIHAILETRGSPPVRDAVARPDTGMAGG